MSRVYVRGFDFKLIGGRAVRSPYGFPVEMSEHPWLQTGAHGCFFMMIFLISVEKNMDCQN